jgi:uncharacterized membrane protein
MMTYGHRPFCCFNVKVIRASISHTISAPFRVGLNGLAYKAYQSYTLIYHTKARPSNEIMKIIIFDKGTNVWYIIGMMKTVIKVAAIGVVSNGIAGAIEGIIGKKAADKLGWILLSFLFGVPVLLFLLVAILHLFPSVQKWEARQSEIHNQENVDGSPNNKFEEVREYISSHPFPLE